MSNEQKVLCLIFCKQLVDNTFFCLIALEYMNGQILLNDEKSIEIVFSNRKLLSNKIKPTNILFQSLHSRVLNKTPTSWYTLSKNMDYMQQERKSTIHVDPQVRTWMIMFSGTKNWQLQHFHKWLNKKMLPTLVWAWYDSMPFRLWGNDESETWQVTTQNGTRGVGAGALSHPTVSLFIIARCSGGGVRAHGREKESPWWCSWRKQRNETQSDAVRTPRRA